MATWLLMPAAFAAGTTEDAPTGLPPVVELGVGEAPATPSPSREAVADLLQQLDALQTALRSLRGQVEIQANEIERLKARQRELLADLDRRVSELEHHAGAAPAGAAPAEAAVPAPAATATSAQEQQDYDAAFGLMKQGYYDRAAKGFHEFLVKYPQSALHDNAEYWLGEAYYVVRKFRPALDEFVKVAGDHPKSEKAPDALLKIGYSYYELGNWAKARENLNLVIARYPGTPAAKSAGLRIAKMKKEGH
jgi:tol-pal system protein YbgF